MTRYLPPMSPDDPLAETEPPVGDPQGVPLAPSAAGEVLENSSPFFYRVGKQAPPEMLLNDLIPEEGITLSTASREPGRVGSASNWPSRSHLEPLRSEWTVSARPRRPATSRRRSPGPATNQRITCIDRRDVDQRTSLRGCLHQLSVAIQCWEEKVVESEEPEHRD